MGSKDYKSSIVHCWTLGLFENVLGLGLGLDKNSTILYAYFVPSWFRSISFSILVDNKYCQVQYACVHKV